MDMTSLDDSVVLVTGATDGLGRALAVELAAEGATVLVHGRDPRRIADTTAQIKAETGSDKVRTYQADLADLKQVRALAEQVLANEPRLDVLVNNAGIGSDVPGGGARQESADGYELRFAVNYLAGYALTESLVTEFLVGEHRGSLPVRRDTAPALGDMGASMKVSEHTATITMTHVAVVDATMVLHPLNITYHCHIYPFHKPQGSLCRYSWYYPGLSPRSVRILTPGDPGQWAIDQVRVCTIGHPS